MADRVARLIAETYRWQRRLGAQVSDGASLSRPQEPEIHARDGALCSSGSQAEK